MVKIRLKRMGTTKRPVYRLVVADSRSPRDGRFIESIGFYDPLPNPAVVRIDAERVQLWLKRGARPSDSARQLLVKEGILAARPFKITVRVETAEPADVSTSGAATNATSAASASNENGATAETSVDEPASGATAAGDVAGGSPEAIPEEPRGGVPATAGPATDEPLAEGSSAAEDEEPAE